MLANLNFPTQLQWRSHELAAVREIFGDVQTFHSVDSRAFQDAEVIRWFPPSEDCSPDLHRWMQQQRDRVGEQARHINDVRNFMAVHDKVECFDTWATHGIPIPRYFTWQPGRFHDARGPMDPPFLLRINNGVMGQDSWLVREEKEVEVCLSALEARSAQMKGAVNRLLCTEFIDTRAHGFDMNVSFRIIVAGGKVVTGFGRVSDPADWVATTNKFNPKIAEGWLFWNTRCQEIMTTQADLLVKAVESLGLNHQGLDVIPGPDGKIYFLEVQTTYDAGFIGAGPYIPPFYNPYNPELIKFIHQNERMLEEKIPLYFHQWLNKLQHFRTCYANLKASFQ